MKIIVETIPHDQQRYETCGDWTWAHDGTLRIFVSELGDFDAELDVAIHEMIEARLCQKHGISDHAVTTFDLQFEKEQESGKHSVDAEPGNDERSPYRDEHESATFVERAAASVLGPEWNEHGRKISEL